MKRHLEAWPFIKYSMSAARIARKPASEESQQLPGA